MVQREAGVFLFMLFSQLGIEVAERESAIDKSRHPRQHPYLLNFLAFLVRYCPASYLVAYCKSGSKGGSKVVRKVVVHREAARWQGMFSIA